MDDDIDIYADLSSFNLIPEKKDHDCNCEELKEELSSLKSKHENLQRDNTNLVNNLSSLLKTARSEITRKNKTIDDLRKRLDDVTFRRSHNYKPQEFSICKLPYQHTVTKKYEDVSSTHSQESETEETESYQMQLCHNEYKGKKPQNEVHRIPTVFGERLHKRIIEEKKQQELIKLAAETKTKDISKEDIIEKDKKTGSSSGMNNNDNDSNVGRYSNSEPSYGKNLMKRTNEEDDTNKHKRIKIEKNEEKTVTELTNNYLAQYDLTDNFAQYEIKDNIKLENQLDAGHSFKKEEVSYCDERRTTSEYRDTKENRNCTNGWRSEMKNKSAKDYDSSSSKNGHAHSLRNSRATSTSRTTHTSERYNSGYRRNGHRYSPLRRSYSRSRSDYESSSNHRLHDKFSRTHRQKKYDDYKYDSRYKNDRLKRNYEKEEDDRKTRYWRDNRYSLSDDDKESNSFYKNKKYENRRTRKEMASVLNDKKLYIGTTEQMRDSDIISNDKNDTNKKSEDSVTEIIKIKEMIGFNIDTKIKEIDDSSMESVPKKEVGNLNIGNVEITEINNFNNGDSIHKIDDEEIRISAAKVTKVEALPNCDIEDRDKSQVSIERETFHQMSNKSANATCLNDHNYVQSSSINVSDLDAIQKPSLRSERSAAILDTASSKETKAEETVNVQSFAVKKTISSVVKNKKDQQNRGTLISHRRKAVKLSDSNASMTVLMNTAKTSFVTNNCNNNDSTLKPRACKISRVTGKTTCK
ncbi:PREDICTED: asparagine-rich protein-like [Cyphomyrmex costatus]|uniref:asparagine-rich protein-like n=1 Tax=Cyphomyrmex costatus TaxID=456900 RepID=UPI0008523093|nr:PREDICTED: asparagine-rich protein-like [Cyphomyrmex costatus]